MTTWLVLSQSQYIYYLSFSLVRGISEYDNNFVIMLKHPHLFGWGLLYQKGIITSKSLVVQCKSRIDEIMKYPFIYFHVSSSNKSLSIREPEVQREKQLM